MRTSVEADLCFRVEDADGQRIDGHLTGSGQVLTLHIDDPGAFAGAGDAAAVRYVADELAARRLEVRVTDGRSTLVRPAEDAKRCVASCDADRKRRGRRRGGLALAVVRRVRAAAEDSAPTDPDTPPSSRLSVFRPAAPGEGARLPTPPTPPGPAPPRFPRPTRTSRRRYRP